MGLLLGKVFGEWSSVWEMGINFRLCACFFFVLIQTGLDKGKCTVEDISKLKSMVPKSLEKCIEGKCHCYHILIFFGLQY